MRKNLPALGAKAREKLALKTAGQRYSTARTAIRAVAWAFAAWVAFRTIERIAGTSTELSFALSLIVEGLATLKVGILSLLAFGLLIWALVERKLRHRKVETMQARIRELETAIDPNRTSSGLTPQGKTNPRDRGA